MAVRMNPVKIEKCPKCGKTAFMFNNKTNIFTCGNSHEWKRGEALQIAREVKG